MVRPPTGCHRIIAGGRGGDSASLHAAGHSATATCPVQRSPQQPSDPVSTYMRVSNFGRFLMFKKGRSTYMQINLYIDSSPILEMSVSYSPGQSSSSSSAILQKKGLRHVAHFTICLHLLPQWYQWYAAWSFTDVFWPPSTLSTVTSISPCAALQYYPFPDSCIFLS